NPCPSYLHTAPCRLWLEHFWHEDFAPADRFRDRNSIVCANYNYERHATTGGGRSNAVVGPRHPFQDNLGNVDRSWTGDARPFRALGFLCHAGDRLPDDDPPRRGGFE